jgi:hypothetical protein
MTPHLDIVTIGPDTRSRRIAEYEAVLADLRANPVDVEPYHAEVASVQAELLSLLVAEG